MVDDTLTRFALHAPLKKLLEDIGREGEFSLTRLPGGANNQSYGVFGSNWKVFLKVYFRHPVDPRDRLSAEFSFCKFAWNGGVRSVPEPLAKDDINGFGIYEHVDGTTLKAEEIRPGHVEQFLEFVTQLNRNKSSKEAQALPVASETSFSIEGHLMAVERHLMKYKALNLMTPLHEQTQEFAQSALFPAWVHVCEEIRSKAPGLGIILDEELPFLDRILSPSDFGFHNALGDKNGRLRFIDFEYAGWDDPAKMVNDFFFQPRIPVPEDFYPSFFKRICQSFKNAKFHEDRIKLLKPVFGMKWCCIMLNDFTPVGEERRRFSLNDKEWETRLSNQLDKAKNQVRRVYVKR